MIWLLLYFAPAKADDGISTFEFFEKAQNRGTGLNSKESKDFNEEFLAPDYRVFEAMVRAGF